MNQNSFTFKLNHSLTSSYVFSNGTTVPLTTENESFIYTLLAVPFVSICLLVGLFFYSNSRNVYKIFECKNLEKRLPKVSPNTKGKPNENLKLKINLSFDIYSTKKTK